MSKEKKPIPKPYGNRVLVIPDGVKETEGGILLPANSEDKFEYGTVVAVGPGTFDKDGKRLGSDCKIGDSVIFTRGFKAVEFDHGGKKYISVFENDLVASV